MNRHVSVLVPFVPARAEQIMPFAAFVQWRGAAALWQGQGMTTEQHQVFTQVCGLGARVPFGIGVSLMPLRHPAQAALEARTLAAASGHPVTAAFGPGAPEFQRALLGSAYPSPLTAAREYLAIVRALLTKGEADQGGTYFSYRGRLPQLPTPSVRLGLGTLRPGMARLAGEVADVTVSWLTPPGYLRDVLLPAVREGAEKAGRPAPRIVTVVPTALERAGRDTIALLTAGSELHLRAPHYRAMLNRAGVPVDPGRPRESVRAAVEAGAMATGSTERIAETVTAYHDAGVDEVVLNCTGVAGVLGPHAALEDLNALFTGTGWGTR
ncbi:LLM class flavin-dependent oxidoreductase [Kitasatospora sp. NPDC050463]|uniref:LLM class flavin-dependent oxidoreductase n=1 Tax=Kitasatospora sp. NPDC050463 TaxID=3155786 RepID=UPI0033CE9185